MSHFLLGKEGKKKSPNLLFIAPVIILGAKKGSLVSIKPQVDFVPSYPVPTNVTGFPLRYPGRVLLLEARILKPALNGPWKNGAGGLGLYGMNVPAWCELPLDFQSCLSHSGVSNRLGQVFLVSISYFLLWQSVVLGFTYMKNKGFSFDAMANF